jgi:hypothetical protein
VLRDSTRPPPGVPDAVRTEDLASVRR